MTLDASDLERLAAWADVIDDSNYYEILGVLPLADEAAIKAAFHDLALAFHPDVYADAPEDAAELAQALFRRVAEAYRVLSDPDLRATYDLELARGNVRIQGGETAARGGPSGLQSLEDVCRTPAARLLARRADAHIGRGELAEARQLLREAISQDGYENTELEERLEALEFALFAQGS
ncbi:MAG TPA: J domain-containing protein [Polyangiaceae bacterium]|nr:J domain-containing protein [Polyangiaceae bacterium]